MTKKIRRWSLFTWFPVWSSVFLSSRLISVFPSSSGKSKLYLLVFSSDLRKTFSRILLCTWFYLLLVGYRLVWITWLKRPGPYLTKYVWCNAFFWKPWLARPLLLILSHLTKFKMLYSRQIGNYPWSYASSFYGNTFKEERPLSDYKSQKDINLHLVLCLRGGIHIFLKILTGNTTDID